MASRKVRGSTGDSLDSDYTTERELAEDAPWKLIQKNCFTRWTNEHLKVVNKHIGDLETDLSDGLRFIALMEVLSGKTFQQKYSRRPVLRPQKLENVTMALKFLERDEGIRIVNIDSSDIVDHKLKLILGLIWTLILHYSISLPVWDDDQLSATNQQTTATPKQRLLAWIQNKIPDRPITNFTTDWNDGRAIGALVDGIAPGLCPDWEDWDPADCKTNATEAMDAAEQWLDVPQLVRPEELCNPRVDDLSMMTYLSQFPHAKLKPGAPLRPRTNPHKVRAYGPGLDVAGNSVKAPANFTVETFGAGRGDLEVFVIDPQGLQQTLSSKSNNDKLLTYNYKYIPTMEGQYKIHVKFAGREIPKSPFLVNVAGQAGDASKVTVSGPGIQPTGLVTRHKTYFNIHTTDAGLGVVEVDIENVVSHERVRCVVSKQSDELWTAEFTPTSDGQHNINVQFAGEHIPNSPFITTVIPAVDAKKCIVSGRGIQRNGVRVHDLALFRVSTVGAGDGDLKVKVQRSNDIEDHVDITQVDTDLYECSYKPLRPGTYCVSVTYGGQMVPHSPFTVNIGAASTCRVRAFGPGLVGGVIGFPACFTVETNNEKGALSFSISGPSQAEIECEDNQDGSADATYYPTSAGQYVVHILFNEQDINESPFIVNIQPTIDNFDPSQVTAEGTGLEPQGVVVNDLASFSVNTENTGCDAELRVSVYDIDNNLLDIECDKTDKYSQSFTYRPTRNVRHTVYITYGGVNIPQSPYRVYVQEPSDPSKVNVYGAAIDRRPVTFQQTQFTVDCTDAGPGDVAVSLFDNRGQDVVIETTDNGNNTFDVAFEPRVLGVITAKVYFADIEIPSSPFYIHVDPHVDLSEVKVQGLDNSVYVDCETEFSVVNLHSVDNLNVDKLTVIVRSPSGDKTAAALQLDDTNNCRCYYTPLEQGEHIVDVHYDRIGLPSGPLNFTAISGCDVTKVKAYGPGLSDGLTGRDQVFTVVTRGAGRGRLNLSVSGPVDVDVACTNNEHGQCTVNYTPTLRGSYLVNILFADQHITGSPFSVVVKDVINAAKVRCSFDVCEVRQDEAVSLTIDATEAGDAGLDIHVTDPLGEYRTEAGDAGLDIHVTDPLGNSFNHVSVSQRDKGCFLAKFTPNVVGQWKANVSYGQEAIPNSPLTIDVLPKHDATKVKVQGQGIQPTGVHATMPTSFTVDTSQAGHADLDIDIKASDGSTIKPVIQHSDNGVYTIMYTPTMCDQHVVSVLYGSQHVKHSPFHITVCSTGIADNVTIVDGANSVIAVNQQYTITLSTQDAGEGHVTCHVTGTDNDTAAVDIIETDDNIVLLKYTPTLEQCYNVAIYYGGQLIPDGQFTQQAVSTEEYESHEASLEVNRSQATKLEAVDGAVNGYHDVTDGENIVYRSIDFNVPVGPIFNFITAVVRTPSGLKGRPQVIDCHDGFIQIHYTPTEQGRHYINVAYNELPINGSPFEFTAEPVDLSLVTADGPGLSHGVATSPCRFTVYATDTMPGGLSVAIEGPSKAEVDCTDNEASCCVSYLPQVAGEYNISVKFAGHHINGSPFTANIAAAVVDQKSSTACLPVNSQLHSLHVTEVDIQSLSATVLSPSGVHSTDCSLHTLEDGHLAVKFLAQEAGDHLVNVYRNNKHIKGSPFNVCVNDTDLGNVENVKVYGRGLTQGHCEEPCQFYIDTNDAGCGNVSLSIEGASKADIECSDNGDGTCCVTYYPTAAGVYIINVLFAEQHVQGSPFLANIQGDSTFSSDVNFNHRRQTSAEVSHIGSECELTLKLPGTELCDLSGHVTSPSGVNNSCDISCDTQTNETSAVYRLVFVPRETGVHSISVLHHNKHVPGSPFEFIVGPVKNGGAQKVSVTGSGLELATLDEPGRFMISSREAGLGRLSVAMEGPSKSDIYIDDLKDGICQVSYTCTQPGAYLLSIKFDDVHVANSPFKVAVAPSSGRSSKQTMQCRGLGCQVNKPASFSLDITAPRDQLEAYVLAPSGAECNTIIQEIDKDRYCVRFIPRENGVHFVHIKHNKADITGSPFKLVVGSQRADASLVVARGTGLTSTNTGTECRFTVDTIKAGDGSLAVTVDGPSKVQLDCSEVPCGYEFHYTPVSAGVYVVSIKYAGDVHIPGSPFHVTVQDAAHISVETVSKSMTHTSNNSVSGEAYRVVSRGKGLEVALVNNEATFTVDTSAATGVGMLLVGVLGPSGPCKEVTIRHSKQHEYNISYRPAERGQYIIGVLWADQHIPGSPFRVTVR